jgi:hypothetical protein
MHIDAIRTAVHLRNSQIHKVDQFLGKAAFLNVDIHTPESLVTVGRSFGVFDTVAHDQSLFAG